MRTSFVFLVVVTLSMSGFVSAQPVSQPDTGELPANAGTVIDKTRPGTPPGSKPSTPVGAASTASSPASAASGVLRIRPRPASAVR